jgi:hypothetical protein
MGDLGIRILAAQLNGSRELATALNIGWGGDRFRVYDVHPGGALVWYIVWDTPAAAARFERTTGAALMTLPRPNYRFDLANVEVDGGPATRIVIGPAAWAEWARLPPVSVVP